MTKLISWLSGIGRRSQAADVARVLISFCACWNAVMARNSINITETTAKTFLNNAYIRVSTGLEQGKLRLVW
jgi:hypothetical protein